MDEQSLLSYLSFQFSRARPVLFTGAGFSVGGVDTNGRPLPSALKLTEELWNLVYPADPYDGASALQDIYHVAVLEHRQSTINLLRDRLTVGRELPVYYKLWLSGPWHRIYTLNIDDLPLAFQRSTGLPRQIVPVSATSGSLDTLVPANDPNRLAMVYLNGMLKDIPDKVTFSRLQYTSRTTQQEPFYASLASDLISRPVIFVGTVLEEPLFWQHILLRRAREQQTRELRPKSILVTPKLDKAKQRVLEDLNVMWVPKTAEEFATQILAKLQAEYARAHSSFSATASSNFKSAPDVAELIAVPTPKTRSLYLLGAEPTWQDLSEERAIQREIDERVLESSLSKLGTKATPKRPLVVTGTAGTGKSTVLMRLALSLSTRGFAVAYADKDVDLSPRQIRMTLDEADRKVDVLVIDDVDRYGSQARSLLYELSFDLRLPLVIVSSRASRIEKIFPSSDSHRFWDEEAVPYLTDKDIDHLIDLLEKENLLGVLKGKPRTSQQAAFRNKAGRQLLVALYEVTTGKKFEERVIDEYVQLEAAEAQLYLLVALASSLQYSIDKDELLVASGDPSNVTLNAIDALISRGLLLPAPYRATAVKSRHRMIAQTLADYATATGIAGQCLQRLAFLAASNTGPQTPINSRSRRLLIRLINHDYLKRVVQNPGQVRDYYGSLEEILNWDYHYWLQRGSYEVENGSLELAQNYLSQARALSGNDHYVLTEYAYLLFRTAIEHPNSVTAKKDIAEALSYLDERIDEAGKDDSYPFHVMGTQILAWTRRADLSVFEKKVLLDKAIERVASGQKIHHLEELQNILQELEREKLSLSLT